MTHRSSAVAGLLLLLAASAPSVASAQIPDSVVPLKTVISETNTFRTEFAEHYNNKDIPHLVGMYTQDAIRIADDGSINVGLDAIRKSLTAQAATMPHIVIKSDSVIAFGSSAIDVGTITSHPQGGGEMVARYLVVLRRNYGQWKIVRAAVVPVK